MSPIIPTHLGKVFVFFGSCFAVFHEYSKFLPDFYSNTTKKFELLAPIITKVCILPVDVKPYRFPSACEIGAARYLTLLSCNHLQIIGWGLAQQRNRHITLYMVVKSAKAFPKIRTPQEDISCHAFSAPKFLPGCLHFNLSHRESERFQVPRLFCMKYILIQAVKCLLHAAERQRQIHSDMVLSVEWTTVLPAHANFPAGS